MDPPYKQVTVIWGAFYLQVSTLKDCLPSPRENGCVPNFLLEEGDYCVAGPRSVMKRFSHFTLLIAS